MRTSTSLKLIGLIALGASTSAVTAVLLAKPQLQRPPASTTTLNPGPGAVSPSANGVSKLVQKGAVPVAVFQLLRLDVEAVGRDVIVSAEAYLRDARPNRVFLWSLRVYDGEDRSRILMEHHYNDQVFTLPAATREARPAFDERIALPLGDYQVEVSIFQLPAGFDLVNLNDETVASRHRGFSMTRHVTIR
jgi:hypothetical protein